MKSALIFDIQRFSIHDGPGIRTTIFFKGCSLDCVWCQNPESSSKQPEIAFYADRCDRCGLCYEVCGSGAIRPDNDQLVDWAKCQTAGDCVEACPREALRLIGSPYPIAELDRDCVRDRVFYDQSGGGVTLSGGEPILHSEFLKGFLPILKKRSIHVLLETAGNYSFSLLEPLLSDLDFIYFDYKLPGEEAYRRYTGSSDELVRENLRRLVELSFPMRVRMPMVPGVNTEPEQIARMCNVLRELGVEELSLLNYNSLWEAKIPRLNTKRTVLGLSRDDIDIAQIEALFKEGGIRAGLDQGMRAEAGAKGVELD